MIGSSQDAAFQAEYLEVQQLRAELGQTHAALNQALSEMDRLSAELRAAVDALRPFAVYANSIGCNGERPDRVAWNSPYKLTIGDCRDARSICSAYDAEHGEGA